MNSFLAAEGYVVSQGARFMIQQTITYAIFLQDRENIGIGLKAVEISEGSAQQKFARESTLMGANFNDNF
jgi:hypothetical protein